MAAADVAALRAVQPAGPYTLWGYSFGARVAFEAAWLLERAGEEVDHLLLIAPGSPRLPQAAAPGPTVTAAPGEGGDPVADFTDRTFRAILYSVFAAGADGPLLAECLRQATDEESFADFVVRRLRRLDPGTVRRVIRLVRRTYGWLPADRRVTAPVTVLTARGDEESHLERLLARTGAPATLARLDTDHYGALRDPGVDELSKTIRRESRRLPCRT
ncbi:alpha/beta hydrolase [Streptomyces sp. TG1A-8]|uniref:alpha/beta hydrolase n=1 Tax=Streptomyces sp. TG1A-8 TaxID=3051385 RepID=UPI00265BEEE0|nr:alpha/beta hydrolase [Streptomyces sp. TG1A-8]MDO0925913.1 alpha/beta hydrolase [Streptomyces sp. TG1A-8]